MLADGLNASWQSSDDMERMGKYGNFQRYKLESSPETRDGYTTLMAILRSKVQLVNMDVFHVLLEFLGVDFAAHESVFHTFMLFQY